MSLLEPSEHVRWPTQFPQGVGGCRGARYPPPPTKRKSSISAVAAEDAVRSVSFLLGGTVIGVDATWFEWGSFGGMSIGISACRLGLVSASPCSGLLLCV